MPFFKQKQYPTLWKIRFALFPIEMLDQQGQPGQLWFKFYKSRWISAYELERKQFGSDQICYLTYDDCF